MSKASVESLQEQIGELVAERQALRTQGGSATALEQNRRRIARLQWELSRALIARNITGEQVA